MSVDLRRRRKLVRVDLDFIESLVKEGTPDTYTRCVQGTVPKDAKLVLAVIDPAYNGVVLGYEHESFPEVPYDGNVPYAWPLGMFQVVHVTADELKVLSDLRGPHLTAGCDYTRHPTDSAGRFVTANEHRAMLGKPPLPPEAGEMVSAVETPLTLTGSRTMPNGDVKMYVGADRGPWYRPTAEMIADAVPPGDWLKNTVEKEITMNLPPPAAGSVRPSSRGWEIMTADGWAPASYDEAAGKFFRPDDDASCPAPHVAEGQ